MRIAFLVEQLGPYHAARLRAIGSRAPDGLTVLEVAGGSGTSAWPAAEGAPARVTLFPDRSYETLARREIAAATRVALDAVSPHVVAVNGWSFAEAQAAIGWAARRARGVVLLSDSRREDRARACWREAVKRRFVAACGSAFVAGRPQRAYLLELGMAAERVFTGYDVIDNAHFRERARRARAEGRRPENVPARYAIAVGRLIEEKNYPTLLRAHAAYLAADPGGMDLVVVGDGPLGATLLEQVAELGSRERVWFVGRRSYEEIPLLLAGADLFVQASVKDTWGLAVNEAMAAELPVLVSTGCGCAEDLVVDGHNGWRFDPRDADALAVLFGRMSTADRATMGAVSSRIVDAWNLDRHAEQFLRAVRVAAAQARPVSWLDPVRFA